MMKRKLHNYVATLVASFLLVGCATVAPGNDPLVVRAEQTTKIAVNLFDSFLKYEYQNRTLLAKVDVEIRKQADHIRANAPKWIEDARVLTKAYKMNRTPENKANLITVLSVLDAALTIINNYTKVL